MKICLVAVSFGPRDELKSPWIASMILLTSGDPMSNWSGWYGSSVTEFLLPGTRNSERSFPPKIFVIGDSNAICPEDLVTAGLCLWPTSSHPSTDEPSGDIEVALPVGVDAPEAAKVPLLIARQHSSCNSSKRNPKNS